MDISSKAVFEDRTPEALLADRIRAGDRSAEEELVKKYRAGVLMIATARTRDPEAARDLVQEIFIHVLKAARDGQLREPEKLGAFIQGTARNVINNFLRTRTRSAECAPLRRRSIRRRSPDLRSMSRRYASRITRQHWHAWRR